MIFMSEKRKLIFKEAIFNVPILLILTILTSAAMFLSGRSAYDVRYMIRTNLHSDPQADVTSYLTTSRKSYKIDYSYGDKNENVLYAEFKYEGKGDTPKSILTLYEARSGFDAGEYTIEWFKEKEYVTYTPFNSTASDENYEQYSAEDVPVMYNFVSSYSWNGAMLKSGAADEQTSGYSFMGLKLFVWDYTDEGIIRECFMWGIGGNPREMYSYIRGTDGEYKKMVLK